ncbi:Leukocyte elastase inhibitor C [Caligus rogercresseyi]|uniref:Leukocyte elastase inhibitor C n=1 Tax=Caligus rogercresseyi TaxID=217165 RepID=A0A7T8KHE9_CALRO|nr:Leukocyte elastase inhibitor C [Caligus rogercresseyi]
MSKEPYIKEINLIHGGQGIHSPGNEESSSPPIEPLLDSKENSSVKLETAHGLFPSNKTKVHHNYVQDVLKYLSSDVQSIDYSNAQTASNQLNEWLSSKTHDNIKDVFIPCLATDYRSGPTMYSEMDIERYYSEDLKCDIFALPHNGIDYA